MTEKELGLKYNRAAVSLYKTPKVIRLTEEMRDVIVGAIQKAGSKMELARQTGIHEYTIYCWLCNANNPRRSSFNRIKNYLSDEVPHGPKKQRIKQRLTNAELKQLKNIELHLKSKTLVYVFNNKREPITLQYTKGESLRIQAKNIMYRYSDMNRKELEVFKLED
jgi:hypothetical protein